MSSNFYKLYMKHCDELKQMMEQYRGDANAAKKLRGVMMVELLRKEITNYFTENKLPFKVSAPNAYICGSKYEYDLLIVKELAVPYMELVYKPEDVVAVIESKVGGLRRVDTETNSIAKAVNCAQNINPSINFGYITLSENVPVNLQNKDGKPTIRHWDLTKKYLRQKIQGKCATYAVTLHQGKKLCDDGSDDEFIEFINSIVKEE